MKILIVDDEEGIRKVIKEYCDNENYETDEASNGKEALEKLKVNDYDILVLDIMMPQMDGFTMLKELPDNRKIPTIVLSARGEEYDKLSGFDLGIDDYLTKPFSPKELIARIKAVTKRVKEEKDELNLDVEKNITEQTVEQEQQQEEPFELESESINLINKESGENDGN